MVIVIMIITVIIIITKPFTGIFPRTLATNPKTAEHQSIISLNSILS